MFLFCCLTKGTCFVVLSADEDHSKGLIGGKNNVRIGDDMWLLEPKFEGNEIGEGDSDSVPILEVSKPFYVDKSTQHPFEIFNFNPHPNHNKYSFFCLR